METNANSKLLAALLADSRKGTFTGLITTKKGETKGRGAEKKLYGDDTVHVCIVTGFKYDSLVKRSLDKLSSITDDMVLAKEPGLDAATIAEARAELVESFTKSLAGTNESTTDHVYDPLVVNDVDVRGSRVYKCVKGSTACHCRACTGDEKAPLDGTIYLQGLAVWSVVLTPAANGPVPAPKSAPKTLAKNALKSFLPVAKYVSYALEPGTSFILAAGGTAMAEATTKGFNVTDEIVDVVSKLVA
jgi:hypothetical protein